MTQKNFWQLFVILLASFQGLAAAAAQLGPKKYLQRVEPEELKIAAEFKIQRSDTSALQEQLHKDYGIIAVNKTDEHAAIVLRSLVFLLKNGPRVMGGLKTFRYLYAYHSHDSCVDIAAYHWQAKAVSIGGRSSYPGFSEKFSLPVLAALAHEIGHAFLFENMTPQELAGLVKRSGDWNGIFQNGTTKDFYSQPFMTSHEGEWRSNPTSQYSATNIHEWFAGAFSAFVLQKFGQANLLGPNWKKRLVFEPTKAGDYWTNYNNIPVGFSEWLQTKMGWDSKMVLPDETV